MSKRISKIIPSFLVDKASCTRQFESELSLHSLASLFPIKEGIFSNPSVSLSKGSSTSNQAFLLRRKDVTALRCSEPLRYKVGGASKPSPCCAGWDRLGKRVLSLKFIWFTACIRGILSIYCEFLGILEYADEFTTQSSFYTSNGLSREVMSAC